MYNWSESDDNPIINSELDSVLCYPQLMTKRQLFKLIKEVFHIFITFSLLAKHFIYFNIWLIEII